MITASKRIESVFNLTGLALLMLMVGMTIGSVTHSTASTCRKPIPSAPIMKR